MSDYLDKITVGSTTYDIKDSNAYVLPSTGMPSSDMAADVRAALDSANSAYQKPGTGIPSSDLAAGVIPVVPTAYDTAAQALGTASAGTSISWARGDHIHPMPSASDVGAVTAPASASTDNVLAYNGSAWVPDKRTVILSYGHSTWAEFISAYNANAVVYCRASSNSNPSTGSQTRMAFMAYVNSADSPTNVEFQYYRSMNSHSVTQQGDQMYVYKLDKTAGWTVTIRENYTKINVSTGLASSYSNSALTITNPAAVPTGGTTGQALVKTSSSNYALAWQTIDAGHSIPSGGLNGQVLAKSSDDDYAVAWTTASGGGNDIFLVTVTYTNKYIADKTYNEISAAYSAGKTVILTYSNQYYYFNRFQSNIFYFTRTVSTYYSTYSYTIYINSYDTITYTSDGFYRPTIPNPLMSSNRLSVYYDEDQQKWMVGNSEVDDISYYFNNTGSDTSNQITLVEKTISSYDQEKHIGDNNEQYYLYHKYMEWDSDLNNFIGYLKFRSFIEENGVMKIKTITITDNCYDWNYFENATVSFSEITLGYPSAAGVSF